MENLSYENLIKRLYFWPRKSELLHYSKQDVNDDIFMLLIFTKSTKSLVLERQLYSIVKKSICSKQLLFFPLKGITCMGYFTTYRKTSFIFMLHMAPPVTWCSCLKDYNLLIKINQMLLQSQGQCCRLPTPRSQ